jgi:choline kinase
VKATILAAGVGSRLRPLTDAMPKCMVPVAGRPILGWQIGAYLDAGVRDITVVAGYRAQDVVTYCGQFGRAVTVVLNEAYDRTNNMVSLRLALRGREAEPVMIGNGDVVFDASIASAMVSDVRTNLIAVQPGQYIEESMKVTIGDDGRIASLSKAIARESAFGVSIDLYRFSGDAISAICRAADDMIEKGHANLWTEVAIDAVLPDVPVHPFDIGGRRWIEVDNHTDLADGERLFGVPTP